MPFAIGQNIGGYEFLDVLETARGCRTYKVRNLLAQRLERLKTFPKELQDDLERVERFLREIKIHANLTHPNIASFYNAAQIEGQLVMTTELLDGVTVAEKLENGPLAPADAINFACQALSALSYAHERGVVHRMITPANMTITSGGILKLTGFDLAKAATDPQLTQAGTVMGTLEYISPEQVKGTSQLDGRSDIYSLGAVLYAMAAGRPPFVSKSQFDVMLAHVNAPPQPPGEINPGISPELEQIILKALAKDPAGRFQTAEEFRAALQTIQPAPANAAAAVLLPPLKGEAAPPAGQKPGSRSAANVLPSWLTGDLIALGLFTFLIVAIAFFAFLKISHR
jgi:serine/threonine protein kinase